MAQVILDGVNAIDQMFHDLGEIPWDVTQDALEAMTAVAQQKVRASGESMGVRDPESDVHILDKIKRGKAKKTDDGGYADITFTGSRTRNGNTTRNAEIAFVNEYGKRGQAARPFIGLAMTQNEDSIQDAADKVIGDWIEKTFQG